MSPKGIHHCIGRQYLGHAVPVQGLEVVALQTEVTDQFPVGRHVKLAPLQRAVMFEAKPADVFTDLDQCVIHCVLRGVDIDGHDHNSVLLRYRKRCERAGFPGCTEALLLRSATQ